VVVGDQSAGIPVGPDSYLTAEARIRRAALALFGTQGYEATTTRAIAARAGVSKTLVLHHFSTKDNLRNQIDRDVMATVDEAFSALLPSDVDLASFADGYSLLFSRYPDLAAYMRRRILEPTAQTSELLRRILERVQDVLQSMIAQGRAGEPRDLPATVVLQANLGLTAITLGPVLGDFLKGDEPIETRLARAEVDMAQHGYFAPKPKISPDNSG
jgi:AcrR family transcriptional regulator